MLKRIRAGLVKRVDYNVRDNGQVGVSAGTNSKRGWCCAIVRTLTSLCFMLLRVNSRIKPRTIAKVGRAP